MLREHGRRSEVGRRAAGLPRGAVLPTLCCCRCLGPTSPVPNTHTHTRTRTRAPPTGARLRQRAADAAAPAVTRLGPRLHGAPALAGWPGASRRVAGAARPAASRAAAGPHTCCLPLHPPYMYYTPCAPCPQGRSMMAMYDSFDAARARGDFASLPELHALSSGLKALCTDITAAGIETARRQCGGHGYLLASGLPTLFNSYVQVGQAWGRRAGAGGQGQAAGCASRCCMQRAAGCPSHPHTHLLYCKTAERDMGGREQCDVPADGAVPGQGVPGGTGGQAPGRQRSVPG